MRTRHHFFRHACRLHRLAGWCGAVAACLFLLPAAVRAADPQLLSLKPAKIPSCYAETPAWDFDALSLFTDITCSQLREGVSDAQIDACPVPLLRDVARQLRRGNYPAEFRVAQFKAWEDPHAMAAVNKSNPYSLLDNPAGISVERTGEPFHIFVGKTNGHTLCIKIQDLDSPDGDGYVAGSSYYVLHEGANVVYPRNRGLVYVLYHLSPEQMPGAPAVKIHFASGRVNGYFDIEKHGTDSRYRELLAGAEDSYFDVLGRYMHLTFRTEDYRRYTPDEIIPLLAAYDTVVMREQDFMGLVKYGGTYRNRMYLHPIGGNGNMSAPDYRVRTNQGNAKKDLNARLVAGAECWGVVHEVGHLNQIRPAMRWQGVTEITNNLISLYMQTCVFGEPSRMMYEKSIGGYSCNWYEKALSVIGCNADSKAYDSNDYFGYVDGKNRRLMKLIPFWQLYLYICQVHGDADFYKDIYQAARTADDPPSHGECQTEFVRRCCERSRTDLLPFFRFWGFLTPMDEVVEDYSRERVTVTPEQIARLEQWVAAQGYAPLADCPWLIADNNTELFARSEPIVAGKVACQGRTLTLDGWSGVAMWMVCRDGRPVYYSPLAEFTVDQDSVPRWPERVELYALGPRGEKVAVPLPGSNDTNH